MKKIVLIMMTLATLGGTAMAAAQGPAAVEAKSVEQLTATCAACHGATGVSASGAFPNLAGQYASYIEKALHDYQSGARKNPIMSVQAANLTDQDIKALAAFFSTQESPLYTPALD